MGEFSPVGLHVGALGGAGLDVGFAKDLVWPQGHVHNARGHVVHNLDFLAQAVVLHVLQALAVLDDLDVAPVATQVVQGEEGGIGVDEKRHLVDHLIRDGGDGGEFHVGGLGAASLAVHLCAESQTGHDGHRPREARKGLCKRHACKVGIKAAGRVRGTGSRRRHVACHACWPCL